jgi:hypothetical protein
MIVSEALARRPFLVCYFPYVAFPCMEVAVSVRREGFARDFIRGFGPAPMHYLLLFFC